MYLNVFPFDFVQLRAEVSKGRVAREPRNRLITPDYGALSPCPTSRTTIMPRAYLTSPTEDTRDFIPFHVENSVPHAQPVPSTSYMNHSLLSTPSARGE